MKSYLYGLIRPIVFNPTQTVLFVFYWDVWLYCSTQDISALWGPLNRLLPPDLMEMFAQWVTFVPRVVGHLDPVLLAASCQNLEPLLSLSATPAPRGNIVSTLEVHNPQVGGRGVGA